jgi:integrase/recombinase XerD
VKLSPILHEFFHRYLPYIRGTSRHTIKAYRDAFKLFLPFAAQYHNVKVASLTVDHLCTDLVLAYLDDLEQHRNNIAKTRNHRLAALKSFAKMMRFMHPEHRRVADRIINIPQKRTQKAIVGFLYEEEILNIFEAVDLNK